MGSGHKTFATGSTLSAADLNGYLSDQVVAVFANATARTAGWAQPPDGAHSYLLDQKRLETYEGSGGVGSWKSRRAQGLIGRASTSDLYTAGTSALEYPITGLSLALDLWPGRAYRTNLDLLLNAGAASQRIATTVRGRKGTGVVVSDPAISSSAVIVPTAGSTGRTEVQPNGIFAVLTAGNYTIQPFLVGGTNPPSVLATTRGVMEHYVEDLGPDIFGMNTLV